MFEKYNAYKDSGVEWLGEVPKSWECVRMKHLYRDHSEKNKRNEELLSVTQNQGVVPRSWVENRMVMPSGNLESFKFIRKGDFAISLRSFEGGLEYCHHDGIISPAYTVLKAKRRFESSFYKYLFKSYSFIAELQTSVVGIREGKNISYEELSYSFLPIPPLPEQTSIANFLDRKTAQIDQAISIKEKQIELLKERRQILIHNAVTRGLDPDVKMKESGVEWIGEIPEHWLISKLGFYTTSIQTGPFGTQLHSHEYVENEIAVINPSHIINGEIVPDSSQTISETKHKELSQHTLKKGDIIFGRRGEMGRCALVKTDDNNMICGTGSLKLTLDKSRILPEFLNIYLKIDIMKDWFSLNSVGSTMENLNSSILSLVPILIPTMIEQKKIYSHIENVSQKIATAISLKQKEIEKLKEYKSTLINSAVTGKIKV